ncbi:hypothetical protein [Elongatibacter sediminis]|uniref:Uncharacterized protein n=1 Tax=Elongatibacter sediminis TaxID=3119006 RepID=A0AAW9RAL7_9GAMM
MTEVPGSVVGEAAILVRAPANRKPAPEPLTRGATMQWRRMAHYAALTKMHGNRV